MYKITPPVTCYQAISTSKTLPQYHTGRMNRIHSEIFLTEKHGKSSYFPNSSKSILSTTCLISVTQSPIYMGLSCVNHPRWTVNSIQSWIYMVCVTLCICAVSFATTTTFFASIMLYGPLWGVFMLPTDQVGVPLYGMSSAVAYINVDSFVCIS